MNNKVVELSRGEGEETYTQRERKRVALLRRHRIITDEWKEEEEEEKGKCAELVSGQPKSKVLLSKWVVVGWQWVGCYVSLPFH